MGLRSNVDNLLEYKKITDMEYGELVNLIREHDKRIKNNTIAKTRHCILSEIEFSNMSRDEKNRAIAVVRTAVNKMKFRGNH